MWLGGPNMCHFRGVGRTHHVSCEEEVGRAHHVSCVKEVGRTHHVV